MLWTLQRGVAAIGAAAVLAVGLAACADSTTSASAPSTSGPRHGSATASHVNRANPNPSAAPGPVLREPDQPLTPADGVGTGGDRNASPRTITKAELDKKLVGQIKEVLGISVHAANCAGDLPAKIGQTVDCTTIGNDAAKAFTLLVTSMDGGQVNYSIEQIA